MKHRITPEQHAAHSRLMAVIGNAYELGKPVPCVGPDADDWIDDHPDAQERAADRCLDCACFFACRAYATTYDESAGVWAGRTPTDRSTDRKDAA